MFVYVLQFGSWIAYSVLLKLSITFFYAFWTLATLFVMTWIVRGWTKAWSVVGFFWLFVVLFWGIMYPTLWFIIEFDLNIFFAGALISSGVGSTAGKAFEHCVLKCRHKKKHSSSSSSSSSSSKSHDSDNDTSSLQHRRHRRSGNSSISNDNA